jgi:hypothetical protein
MLAVVKPGFRCREEMKTKPSAGWPAKWCLFRGGESTLMEVPRFLYDRGIPYPQFPRTTNFEQTADRIAGRDLADFPGGCSNVVRAYRHRAQQIKLVSSRDSSTDTGGLPYR